MSRSPRHTPRSGDRRRTFAADHDARTRAGEPGQRPDADQPLLGDDDPLVSWLLAIDGVVPPFCLEVVLSDGSRYSFHSLAFYDDRTGAAIVRIWDFRGLTDEDLDKLREQILELTDAALLANPAALHPRLECADGRLRLADLSHYVESHAPLWPRRGQPSASPPRSIGFTS